MEDNLCTIAVKYFTEEEKKLLFFLEPRLGLWFIPGDHWAPIRLPFFEVT